MIYYTVCALGFKSLRVQKKTRKAKVGSDKSPCFLTGQSSNPKRRSSKRQIGLS